MYWRRTGQHPLWWLPVLFWSHLFASLLRKTGYSLPQGAKIDPLHKKPGPMCLNKEAGLDLLWGSTLPLVP